MGHDRQTKAAMALPTSGFIQTLKGLQRSVPLVSWHAIALIPDFDGAPIRSTT